MPQGLVPPPQTPPVQVWVPLQKLLSSQLVPSATKPSVGQLSLTPSQLSATSQTPAEARHTAVLLASLGQNFDGPVTGLGDVADARRGAAGGAVRQHRIGRAGAVDAVAGLGHVADLARRWSHGTPCCSAPPRRPGRSCWSRRRSLGDVADLADGRGAAHGGGRLARHRPGSSTPDAGADLGDVADLADAGGAADRGRRLRSRPPGSRRSTRCRTRPRRRRRRRRGTPCRATRSRPPGSRRCRRRRRSRSRRRSPAEARQVGAVRQHLVGRTVVVQLPSQTSATSQTPAAARQSAVLLASAGQALLTPSQISATSQTPAEARHCGRALGVGRDSRCPTPSHDFGDVADAARGAALRRALGVRRAVVADAVAGLGDVADAARGAAVGACSWRRPGSRLLDPVQTLGRGRRRRPRRGTGAAGRMASAGQSLPTPSQTSATSQMPAAGAAQRRALGVGRAGRARCRCRSPPASQTPAAGRQVSPAARN